MFERPARPSLRPFVEAVWTSVPGATSTVRAGRERVLPTGRAHVSFRLSGGPLRVYERVEDERGRSVGRAVLGGPRAAAYLKDVSVPAASVGAVLRPGGSEALFGIPAGALAGTHLPLEDVLGAAALDLEARLHETDGRVARLSCFEDALESWISGARALHPAVRHALGRIDRAAGRAPDIGALVAETGLSHRRFVDLFSSQVGLQPKRYLRVRRFQRALHRLADPSDATAGIAFSEGYSDQAHLTRDFRAMAGITPGAFRRAGPRRPNHVPLCD